jgi:transposase-like protein
MLVTIEISCPHCHSKSIKKNGKKSNGVQNYRCKECGRQFIKEMDIYYEGRKAWVVEKALYMLLRGSGFRDIRAVLGLSFWKISQIIKGLDYHAKLSCSC